MSTTPSEYIDQAQQLQNFLQSYEGKRTLLTSWITDGSLDKSLDDLVQLVSARRNTLSVLRQNDLQPGDRVLFNRGKPQYIIGATGTVSHKVGDKVVVTVDVQYRKRLKKYVREDGTVSTPASLIVKI